MLSGEKVDPRERFQTNLEKTPSQPRAEILAPTGDGGGYAKVADGGADIDSPSRPRRKRPKVIDARQNAADAEGKSWDADDPSGGEAREGASWDKDDPEAAREAAGWDDDEAQNPQAEAYVPDEKPAPQLVEDPKPEPAAARDPSPAPAPKPVAKPAPSLKEVDEVINPASSKAQGEVLAKAAVTSMVDKMRAEAHRKGSLSVADIDAMRGELQSEAVALSATFANTLEEFAEARDRANWDEKRDYPFDRLIVKRFSALFKETDMSRFDRVSRRILPGFFLGLNMMLGPEAVEHLQERCRLVVERVREEKGEAFDWEDVYAAKDARTLVLDALVDIAVQFENFERRSEWFVELINGHLTPAEDVPKEDAGWELSPAGVKTFLITLLDDLRRVLSTDQGRQHIAKRHGPEAMAAANQLFKVIDA